MDFTVTTVQTSVLRTQREERYNCCSVLRNDSLNLEISCYTNLYVHLKSV